jgi:hypothetical protein
LQPRHKKVLKEYYLPQAILQSAAAGQLFLCEIRVAPRLLEDLLESLALASFPINPELDHLSSSRATVVRFPVYSEQRFEIEDLLRGSGFGDAACTVTPMAEAFEYA